MQRTNIFKLKPTQKQEEDLLNRIEHTSLLFNEANYQRRQALETAKSILMQNILLLLLTGLILKTVPEIPPLPLRGILIMLVAVLGALATARVITFINSKEITPAEAYDALEGENHEGH